MWRILALALAVSTASAEPAKRACTPAGGVLLEIDQRATGKRTTAATVLFANGAWRSKTFDTDGKLADTEQGCLGPDVRDGIAAALHTATWKVTHVKPSCALSPRWSTFKTKTRAVFTERDCSGNTLDHDSAKALDLIEAYVPVPALDDDALPRPHHVTQTCLNDPLAPGCR